MGRLGFVDTKVSLYVARGPGNKRSRQESRDGRGFSLIETLVALMLGMILLGIGAANFPAMMGGSRDGASSVGMQIRRLRVESAAISQALELYPVDSTTLMVRKGSDCTASTKTDLPDWKFTLARGVSLVSTDWSVCFSSKGYLEALKPIDIVFKETTGGEVTLRVYSGGVAEIL